MFKTIFMLMAMGTLALAALYFGGGFWVVFDPNGRVTQVIDQQPSEWGPLVERRIRIS